MTASASPCHGPSPETSAGQFNEWCHRCRRYHQHRFRKEPADVTRPGAAEGECVTCKLIHASR